MSEQLAGQIRKRFVSAGENAHGHEPEGKEGRKEGRKHITTALIH